MPLLRSATGQVFAALLPQSMTHSLIKADLNEIKKLQGKAPTLHEAKETLKKVRKRGLGHTAGGVLPGVLALAAPIYDHDNQLAAVVTALGPAGHFDDSLTGPTARALLASSRRLSERMGSTIYSSGSGTTGNTGAPEVPIKFRNPEVAPARGGADLCAWTCRPLVFRQ